MTDHYFENELVTLHYYKFGNGGKNMLCFHGYGMHGKQFKVLEETLGERYTFWGFDLFFHKETKLKDQSLQAVKNRISKKQLADLIVDFCVHANIDRFSVIGYSMGSHYATTLVEELGGRIDEYIVAAPSSLNPGPIITFFSKYKLGNWLIEKIALSENGLVNLLHFLRKVNILDERELDILLKEVGTPELRFNFYACLIYLRWLETNESKLIDKLTKEKIRGIFIFGKRDRMFSHKIGKPFFAKFKQAEVVLLDENHELITSNFANALAKLLL